MPALRVERTQASLTDPDLATRQTVAKMCEHIKRGAGDSMVQRLARQLTGASPAQTSENIWRWVKTNCKFVHDERMAAVFGFFDNLDFLISPEVMVRCNPPKGDCDDFTMLEDALLTACGIPWEIVTLKCDPREPWRDSHVFSRALISGARLSVDAIPPATYCGWQVPAEHIFGMQTWGPDGEKTMGGNFRGFQGYGFRGYVRGMGACGDCLSYTVDDNNDQVCETYDNTGCGSTSAPLFPYQTPAVGSTPPVTSSPTQPATSPTNSPFTSFAENMAGVWSKLAGQVIAPQTTVMRTAAGTSITGPASSVASIFGSGGLTSLGGVGMGGGSLLMLGGIAVVGILIFSMAGKR